MQGLKLAIKTLDGYLEVVGGSLVTDRARDPHTFAMSSTVAIDYGATVQLHIGSKVIAVDPATPEMHAVVPQPGQVVDFVIKPLKGSGTHFVDGSPFALLSSRGCIRCSNGNVKVGGAVDTDAPARLNALFQ